HKFLKTMTMTQWCASDKLRGIFKSSTDLFPILESAWVQKSTIHGRQHGSQILPSLCVLSPQLWDWHRTDVKCIYQ
ncbi:hypothetical protein HispidOSU_004100, partial [Sigmodon hispidus]